MKRKASGHKTDEENEGEGNDGKDVYTSALQRELLLVGRSKRRWQRRLEGDVTAVEELDGGHACSDGRVTAAYRAVYGDSGSGIQGRLAVP